MSDELPTLEAAVEGSFDEEMAKLDKEKEAQSKHEMEMVRRDRCIQLALGAKGKQAWEPEKTLACAKMFWSFTEKGE